MEYPMAPPHNKTPIKKSKLVRDSFTIPKAEFLLIEDMKTRAIALGTSVKKSELLRAGLKLLQSLNDNAYKTALAAVPTLKTGRPINEEPEAQASKLTREPADRKAVKAAPNISVKPATQAAAKPVTKPASTQTVKAPAKRSPATKSIIAKTAAPNAVVVKPAAARKSVIKRTPVPKTAVSIEAIKPAVQTPVAEETPSKD